MKSKLSVSAAEIKSFQKKISAYYKKHGRDLPWRNTRDPYRIFVSELMLQQTQALRVIPKYNAFFEKFGSVEKLASASTRDVLTIWQGLGYNRRALYLKRCAEMLVHDYKGRIPKNVDELLKLPGIGPYTARAIVVFSFDVPEVFIETNIRSVYLHEFFPAKEKVDDALLLPLIQKTLPKKGFREWYSALMDYGAMLKSTIPNPSRRGRGHTKQKPFQGSERQIRGEMLRMLLKKPEGRDSFVKLFGKEKAKLADALVAEGFARKKNGKYLLIV
jgi:A/G-specific adenine glycosylase